MLISIVHIKLGQVRLLIISKEMLVEEDLFIGVYHGLHLIELFESGILGLKFCYLFNVSLLFQVKAIENTSNLTLFSNCLM